MLVTVTTRRRSLSLVLSAALLSGLPPLVAAPALAEDATAPAVGTAPAAGVTATDPAAAPAAFALGERSLRRGDTGPDVRKLQKLLRVKRSGTFDKATRKAVKRVQRAAGLTATGRVDRTTLKAVKRSYKRSTASRGLPRAGSPTASRSYARAYIASRYGWDSGQMSCLSAMWQRESGWRYSATNPNGIYRGIPQTSARVWGSMGYTTAQYMRSPEIQVKVGTRYIKQRYGTPCRAWSFWRSHHWY